MQGHWLFARIQWQMVSEYQRGIRGSTEGGRRGEMKDLAALVRSYERAYVEMQRAEDDETERRAERLQRAGNRIWLARYKMFEAAKQ
jgi:hypothetical protein